MKKRKYHIICSKILLICFIAGQYMVYAHQHIGNSDTVKGFGINKNWQGQTVKDKCALCDVMHHQVMLKSAAADFATVVLSAHVFTVSNHNFKSLPLMLSGGRAPPSSICL